jgi:hypothetical protein
VQEKSALSAHQPRTAKRAAAAFEVDSLNTNVRRVAVLHWCFAAGDSLHIARQLTQPSRL